MTKWPAQKQQNVTIAIHVKIVSNKSELSDLSLSYNKALSV